MLRLLSLGVDLPTASPKEVLLLPPEMMRVNGLPSSWLAAGWRTAGAWIEMMAKQGYRCFGGGRELLVKNSMVMW